jgi:hypothetical protein
MNKALWIKVVRLFGAVALVFGGVFLSVGGINATRAFLGSDEYLLSGYSVFVIYEESLQGHNIELVTSPGVNTHITVHAVAKSIQKHWRSRDLQFIVQDPTTSRQFMALDLSRSDYWGEVLESREQSEPVEVSIEWNVPTEIAVGDRLSGNLSGTIEYPVVAGAGFRTATRDLNLPINITIVSEAELVQSIRSEDLSSVKILALIATPLLLIAVVIFYFTDRRHGTKSSKMNISSH